MTVDLDILIKLYIYSALVYVLYRLMLSRDVSFGFRRAYILIATAVSLLLFVKAYNPQLNPGVQTVLPVVDLAVVADANDAYIGWITWIKLIYFIPLMFLFFMFVLRLAQIFHLIRHSDKTRINGIPVYLSDKNITPFSFFNYILISKQNSDDESMDVVVYHELAHSRLWHSADRLFFDLLVMLFWFAPFFWMLKKELIRVHEFQADADAVKNIDSSVYYQNQLLRYAMQATSHTFGNHFSKSLVSKRLKMLNQKSKERTQIMKYLISLPLIVAMIILSGQLPIQAESNTASKSAAIKLSEGEQDMPTYKKGKEALFNDIVSRVKYPGSAKKDGIEGRVFIEFTITKNGEMINAKVKKGFDKACDAEALRVVKSLEGWNPALKDGEPVDASMVIPIQFRLNDKKDKE